MFRLLFGVLDLDQFPQSEGVPCETLCCGAPVIRLSDSLRSPDSSTRVMPAKHFHAVEKPLVSHVSAVCV